jgi:transcriptional regulator HMO1
MSGSLQSEGMMMGIGGGDDQTTSTTSSNEKASIEATTTLPSTTEQVKKTPRKKVNRDPNAPKRPLNSYFLFQHDHYAHMKSINPEITHAELLQNTSNAWNNVSDEVKKKYESKARDLLDSFNEENRKYKESLSNESINSTSIESDKANISSSEPSATPTIEIQSENMSTQNPDTQMSSFNFIPLNSTDTTEPVKKHKSKKIKKDKSQNENSSPIQSQN